MMEKRKAAIRTGKSLNRKTMVAALVLVISGFMVAATIGRFTLKIEVASTGIYADISLFNEQIMLLYTDEAVGISNYTDDTLEPTGWELLPSIFWDSNKDGILEPAESIGHSTSPSVHFTFEGQEHHFWPLHQSIMQDPGDATVISSGWVSAPNTYQSKVEDASQLVTIESTFSVLDGNSYFTQEINVTSTAPATVTDVCLIAYIGIDINGPFNDHAFIDSNSNNMLKAYDNKTGNWFGAFSNATPDAFEISNWKDGPYQTDDLWQHTLSDALTASAVSNGDVEASLRFQLNEIQAGQTKTMTLYYSFGNNESDLYAPEITNRDVAALGITTSKAGCIPAETVGQEQTANITVTVENQGITIETFNVTAYANATKIGSQQITMNPTEIRVLTFIWDTSGFAKGNYSITAQADVLLGETDVDDNLFTYGWIFITLAGDVDADRDVDIYDIVRMAGVYGVSMPDARYDPNSDMDNDGDTDIYDIVIAAGNYGKSW